MPRPAPHPGRFHRRRVLSALAFAALSTASVAGCSHNNHNEDMYPQAPPVLVHVINENYLDMNIAAVIGGVSRRLGDVTGNSTRDFTINMSRMYGEAVTMTAKPIGGLGSFVSGALNVGDGQIIVVHIGGSLRQSIAVLRDTL
jgi:hypothetical protein